MSYSRDIINNPERTLLYFLDDPAVVISAGGRVAYANPSFLRLFDLELGAVIGKRLSAVALEWMHATVMQQFRDTDLGEGVRHFRLHSGNRRLLVNMSGINLKGRVAGAVLTLRDETGEISNSRRNLELFRAMLDDASKFIDDSSAGSKGSGDGRESELIRGFEQCLSRLREFGEVFLGEIKTESSHFYPGKLVKMAQKSMRPAAEQRGVFLEEGMQRELPRVVGDPALLNRVLALLLDYMIKGVREGEAVIAGAELLLSTEGRPRLSYSVTGTGMVSDAEELGEISGRLDSYSGLPDNKKLRVMRLSLARRLVGAMGGDVTVAAHELAGTSISARVPVELHYQGG